MPRLIADGEVRMAWATTMADYELPQLNEIQGGTEVTEFISSLDTPLEASTPDASDVSSAFNKTVAGTFGGSVAAEMYRDDTDDDAFELFTRNATGFLVIRRFGGSRADWANGQLVEVWPLRVVSRSPAPIERDTVQSFNVAFATLDEPAIDVEIGATS